MLTVEQNNRLCLVEHDMPMGRLMRQHWQLVALSEEVPEHDGAPVRARVLGEDLVVFRDSKGQVAVMGEYCPHRGASLFYGRNENCALRCLYHGWKMDASGQVLEMASEPASSGLAQKVRHKAYHVREWAGCIWAHMARAIDGETPAPEFTRPAWAPSEDLQVSVAKIIIPCNWAQILEGQIDSAHSSSLHSSDMVPARVDGAKATDTQWLRPSTDKSPRMQAERTPYGFRYAALRRPIQNGATHDYVRSTVFVAPSSALIPPNDQYNVANINTAMDDHTTAFHFIAWGLKTTTPDTRAWRQFLHADIGADLDAQYHPSRNKTNHFWQDRQSMKTGSYTGIAGIPNQDMAMWVGMGPLANRSHDRLGASDLAIVEFRRRMLDAIDHFEKTGQAIGTKDQAMLSSVCAFQAVLPKTQDWRAYQAKTI